METKRAILAIERILTNAPQNASRIIERLENEYGIIAERKSVYDSSYMKKITVPKAIKIVKAGGKNDR